MTIGARVAFGCVASLALLGCGGDPAPPRILPRHERWAVLRDLVLIERNQANGGSYFLDRFEVSRRDFAHWRRVIHTAGPPGWPEEWGADDAEDDPAALRPAARVDLASARAYAGWRLCRLPTYAEWEYAASASGAYRFPWGDHIRAEWANTPELGLWHTSAIGTFESGRSPGGPYDLVGNVAEWTETLSPSAVRDLAASSAGPAEGLWALPGRPRPFLALVASAPWPLPRLVAGGAYVGLSDVSQQRGLRAGLIPSLSCRPDEWSETTGIRLATDPRSLLIALLREPVLPGDEALGLLRDFVREPMHQDVLEPALASALAWVPTPGPLLAVLRGLLRP